MGVKPKETLEAFAELIFFYTEAEKTAQAYSLYEEAKKVAPPFEEPKISQEGTLSFLTQMIKEWVDSTTYDRIYYRYYPRMIWVEEGTYIYEKTSASSDDWDDIYWEVGDSTKNDSIADFAEVEDSTFDDEWDFPEDEWEEFEDTTTRIADTTVAGFYIAQTETTVWQFYLFYNTPFAREPERDSEFFDAFEDSDDEVFLDASDEDYGEELDDMGYGLFLR